MSNEPKKPRPLTIDDVCTLLARLEGAVSTIGTHNASNLCELAQHMRDRLRKDGIQDGFRTTIPVDGTIGGAA